MRHRLYTLAIAGSILAPISFAAAPCAGKAEPSQLIERLNIGPFTYKMTYDRDTGKGQFKIFRRGKAVYSQIGSHFYINPTSECGDLPMAGTSISGRNRREVAIVDWSGGAHCCYTLFIVALGEQPFLIQKIELEHSWPDFQELDGDGVSELLLSDWTFAYWKVAFAQSPSPSVTLGFNGKQWVYDPKWNRKPRPLQSELLKLRPRIEQGFTDTKADAGSGDFGGTGAPVLLWDEMLKQIYTGHADSAIELINAGWPADNQHKEKFLCEFRNQLQQSPFFGELKKINHRGALLLQKRPAEDCSNLH